MLLLEAERNKRVIDDAFNWCCDRLLQCVPLDSVIKANAGQLPVLNKYMDDQFHGGLAQLLRAHMQRAPRENLFLQISTFANSLSKANIRKLSKELFERPNGVQLVSLQNFESEQTFRQYLREFLRKSAKADAGEVLLVQCDRVQFNLELLACAQYSIEDEWENAGDEKKRQKLAGDASQRNTPIRIVLLVYLNPTWLMQLQNWSRNRRTVEAFHRVSVWHLGIGASRRALRNEVAAAIPHLLALKHRPFSDLFQSRLTTLNSKQIDTDQVNTVLYSVYTVFTNNHMKFCFHNNIYSTVI